MLHLFDSLPCVSISLYVSLLFELGFALSYWKWKFVLLISCLLAVLSFFSSFCLNSLVFKWFSSNSSCFRCRYVKFCWLLLQSLRFRWILMRSPLKTACSTSRTTNFFHLLCKLVVFLLLLRFSSIASLIWWWFFKFGSCVSPTRDYHDRKWYFV
jgi:hypothetical protein